MEFMDEKITNFYLDFAKRNCSYQVLTEALYKITVAAAPILMYTSQEIHYHLQQSWYANEKGLTVFDELWDK